MAPKGISSVDLMVKNDDRNSKVSFLKKVQTANEDKGRIMVNGTSKARSSMRGGTDEGANSAELRQDSSLPAKLN